MAAWAARSRKCRYFVGVLMVVVAITLSHLNQQTQAAQSTVANGHHGAGSVSRQTASNALDTTTTSRTKKRSASKTLWKSVRKLTKSKNRKKETNLSGDVGMFERLEDDHVKFVDDAKMDSSETVDDEAKQNRERLQALFRDEKVHGVYRNPGIVDIFKGLLGEGVLSMDELEQFLTSPYVGVKTSRKKLLRVLNAFKDQPQSQCI